MKAEELMIGDIVRVNKDVSIKKGTIVRVCGIEGDRRFQELVGSTTCIPIDDPDEMSGGVWVKYLDPIPLTDEILVANGFIHAKGKAVIEDIGCAIIYGKYERLDEDRMLNLGDNLWPIRHVHELQHALRLCGIEKEIIVKLEP